nr:flagellar motor protein MotB [Calditrichia bacterium]
MAKKEKPEIEDPTAPFWMATYGDMVTLLLTFFILLVSYSTIQLEKFKGAMESLRGALGVFEGHESVMKEPFIDFNSAEKTQGKPEKQEKIEKTIQDIKNMLNGSKLEDLLEVETLGDGVLFRLGDNLLFEPGRAELKPMALDVLHLIADLVRDSYTNVSVEGHTDNVPIHTRRFPSN